MNSTRNNLLITFRNSIFPALGLLLLFFTGCAQKQSGGNKTVDIQIKVKGLNNGTSKLGGTFADQHYFVDSFKAESGMIHIQRDSLFRSGLYFLILPDDTNIQLLLDADQVFSMETETGNLIEALKVTGSVDNDLLYQSIKLVEKQEKEQLKLQQAIQGKPDTDPAVIAYKKTVEDFRKARKNQIDGFKKTNPEAFITKFKLAGLNPEVKDIRKANGDPDLEAQTVAFRNEYWDMIDFKDPRFMYTPLMANKVKAYFTDLISQHQDTIVKYIDALMPKALENPDFFKYLSNWLLFKYEPGKTTLMDGEAVFSHVILKYFTKETTPWMTPGSLADLQRRAKEMSGSLLNHKALDVIAKDTNGETKSIYGIKSPYIVVYLYHTDCEHCQKETPILSQMYPQLKSRGVEFFTIAVNTTDAEWKKFVTKYGMGQWTNVFDPTNVSIYGRFYVDNTPEIYVLNKDRMIIGKNLKPEQVNTILDLEEKK
ncbi:MAG: thioredoxin-like domain-containing protein [Saprospiraceae bacterium]